jgi:hypothetical protein
MASIISDSIISQGSAVTGGRLGSCEIKGSTLNGIGSHNSSVSECLIENSKLYLSRLHACRLLQGTKQVSKPVSSFRRFSPEIRKVIFKLCKNLDETDCQVPALIVALRGDQVLYHEALEAVYENGTIGLLDLYKLNNAQLRYAQILILV